MDHTNYEYFPLASRAHAETLERGAVRRALALTVVTVILVCTALLTLNALGIPLSSNDALFTQGPD